MIKYLQWEFKRRVSARRFCFMALSLGALRLGQEENFFRNADEHLSSDFQERGHDTGSRRV